MSKLTRDLTYRQAMDELQQIVGRLRDTQDVDVDELLRDVSRAKTLIDFCGSKIRHAGVQIQNVLHSLQGNSPSPECDGRAPDSEDDAGGLFS